MLQLDARKSCLVCSSPLPCMLTNPKGCCNLVKKEIDGSVYIKVDLSDCSSNWVQAIRPVFNQDELTLLLFLPLHLFDLCSLSPGLEFLIYSSSPKETPSLFWAFFLLQMELNCESNWLQWVFSLADSIRIEGTLHLNNPIVLSRVGASFVAIK